MELAGLLSAKEQELEYKLQKQRYKLKGNHNSALAAELEQQLLKLERKNNEAIAALRVEHEAELSRQLAALQSRLDAAHTAAILKLKAEHGREMAYLTQDSIEGYVPCSLLSMLTPGAFVSCLHLPTQAT